MAVIVPSALGLLSDEEQVRTVRDLVMDLLQQCNEAGAHAGLACMGAVQGATAMMAGVRVGGTTPAEARAIILRIAQDSIEAGFIARREADREFN